MKKTNTEFITCTSLHQRNTDTTNELFPNAEADVLQYYTNLPIVAFKRLNVSLLKAFIHVRLLGTASVPKRQLS